MGQRVRLSWFVCSLSIIDDKKKWG